MLRLLADLGPLHKGMTKSLKECSEQVTELKMDHKGGDLKSDRLTQSLDSTLINYLYIYISTLQYIESGKLHPG